MTSQFKTVALLALLSGLIIVLGGAVGGRGGIIGADPRFGGQKDPEKWPVKRAGAGRKKERMIFVYSDGLQKTTRNPLRKINI